MCALGGCGQHANPGPGADLGGKTDLRVAGDLAVGGNQDDLASPLPDLDGPLVISPLDQTVTLTVGMALPTVQFSATLNGNAVSPSWSIDRGDVGQLGVATGLFTASGIAGGKAMVTAAFAGRTASTSLTIKIVWSQVGDPAYPVTGGPGAGGYGGVGGAGPGAPATTPQQTTLNGAATVDNMVRVLYPYDGTVWPRGLLAPLLQWSRNGHNFDSVLVHLQENGLDYHGYFAKPATSTTFDNLPIPQAVWKQLTNSNGGENVMVSLTFAAGTTAYGPYTMSWRVAQATLKGTVYYNSYGTSLVANSGEPSCAPGNTNCANTPANRTGPPFGAATLAIKPGMLAPVVIAGVASANNSGCRVCHSVSANGKRLLTQHGDNGDKTTSLYDLTMPPNIDNVLPGINRAFSAILPDGTAFLSSSGGMINGDTTSRMYALPAGTLVTPAPSGLPANLQAALPSFSPDGAHVTFNFYGGPAGADTKSLGILDYNPMTKVFSPPVRSLLTPTAPNLGTVVWPSFLPTSLAIVYELEKVTNEWGFTRSGNQGELWWIDLTTKTPARLDKLNGLGYLPTLDANGHTAAVEPVLNYEPTVNPIASGGYAWIVFTSRRLYGNVATVNPWTSDPREFDWQNIATTKKLWVAAIDLNAPAGTDPSHPAFYLPAQELYAGNSRGFWSVDPCHKDGDACETGDECCGGYCRGGGDGGALQCLSTPPMCAAVFEKCATDNDCCGVAMGITCINMVCSMPGPPPVP